MHLTNHPVKQFCNQGLSPGYVSGLCDEGKYDHNVSTFANESYQPIKVK